MTSAPGRADARPDTLDATDPNGSAFVDAWLLRACATLGIRLVHSTPGRPQGRGKIERFFRTVREQFLVEITGESSGDPSSDESGSRGRHLVTDLSELNRLFTGWVETIYHRRIHSETGHPPLARWHAGGPFPLPTPAALAEAFLWEAHRTVTKTALVSLQGNTYQVDPLLAGHRSSWCSTRLTCPPSPSASAGSLPGRRSRTAPVVTPTSRPDPRHHPTRRPRPGSTTPA